MKLTKALKLKNTTAGELAQLKELLSKQNVRPQQQKFDYNNAEVLARLRSKIDELVGTKAAIAAANTAVYGRIFRLAELKGLVNTLRSLDVRHGVYYERGEFGAQPLAIEYTAQLTKIEIDKLVAGLQAEIQTLQDELDEFNFTQTVNL